jgi:hypothetical protein
MVKKHGIYNFFILPESSKKKFKTDRPAKGSVLQAIL